jgi:hypothetical protein
VEKSDFLALKEENVTSLKGTENMTTKTREITRHVCNVNYSGGRHWEDCGSKLIKKLARSYFTK